jgi:hypothetical protein
VDDLAAPDTDPDEPGGDGLADGGVAGWEVYSSSSNVLRAPGTTDSAVVGAAAVAGDDVQWPADTVSKQLQGVDQAGRGSDQGEAVLASEFGSVEIA